jgi:ankyrin repeat protein
MQKRTGGVLQALSSIQQQTFNLPWKKGMMEPPEFYEAIRSANLGLISKAVDEDPSILQARGPNGETPILFAIYNGKQDVASLLRDRALLLTLAEACALGDSAAVQEFVGKNPASVNQASDDGFPPLALAAFFGHEEVARWLLANGAKPEIASVNLTRVTALHAASATRRTTIVKLLLDCGADPNVRQSGGYTPLHSAAFNGDEPTARVLLDGGANAKAVDDIGKTPADLARERGHVNLAALF